MRTNRVLRKYYRLLNLQDSLVSSMMLQIGAFGILVSVLGMVFVFSALGVIVLAIEILKRALKLGGFETKRERSSKAGISEDAVLEMAAMAASIYVHETTRGTQLISQQSESSVQSDVWIIAGRMDQLSGA